MDHIKRIDFTAPQAAAEFTESLHQTGFAVLYNHPIKKNAIENLYQQWKNFFLQDEEQKKAFMVEPDNQAGWIPPHIAEVAKDFSIKDIKEFFNYFPWGKCPDNLKKITHDLFQKLHNIGYTLLEWVQQHTPNEIRQHFSLPLPQMIANSSLSLFRINYYPPLSGKEEEGAVRAAKHTDIDLLTVLTAGTTSGLQALTKDGQWHDIPCEHGNLVINTGDMLQECSHAYYPSTVHRVLNPIGEAAQTARMSCPMFIHPVADVVLSERYTAKTYLHERLVEIGLIKE